MRMFDEYEEIRSKLNGGYIISEDLWVLSVVRNSQSKEEETSLVVEGVETGYDKKPQRVVVIYNLSKPTPAQKDNTTADSTSLLGNTLTPDKAEITILENRTSEVEAFLNNNVKKYNFCKTWNITEVQAKKLGFAVEKDKAQKEILYLASGQSSLLGKSSKMLSIDGHNGFTWAKAKIKDINAVSTFPDKWTDIANQIPSSLLSPKK